MEKVVVYLFFLFSLYLVFAKKLEFIYLIPIFNVLADISFNYFEAFSAPTILRAIILVIFFIYYRSFFSQIGSFKPLMFFLLYTLLMLVFTTEFWYSFRGVTQVILSMLMLIVGYIFCINYSRFKLLIKTFTWIIVIGVVATALGYIFGIGKLLEYTATEEFGGGEKVGLLGSAGLYAPAIVLGLLPIILKMKLYPFKRWIFMSICFVLFIFILLNVRRTAIFIPVVGLISYLIFSETRIRTFRLILLAAVVLGLSFPLYSNLLEKRFKVREEEGRFSKDFYKTEERFSENVEMIESIFTFNNPEKVLFGWGNNIFAEHIKDGTSTGRMYHSDSARLFYGVGILGLVLYLLIYFQIFMKIVRIPKASVLTDIRASAFSLLFISVFVSFNGSISLITFRSINFLLLGAFIGFAYSIIRNNGSISTLQE